jgi:hypothetical protein
VPIPRGDRIVRRHWDLGLGGEERAQADNAWLEQHRDALVDAIGGRS